MLDRHPLRATRRAGGVDDVGEVPGRAPSLQKFFALPRDPRRVVSEVLRVLRRDVAAERGVPPFVIFSDKTLREIARVRPSTLYELRRIYGIGDAKLEAFGDALVTQIRDHCAIAPS